MLRQAAAPWQTSWPNLSVLLSTAMAVVSCDARSSRVRGGSGGGYLGPYTVSTLCVFRSESTRLCYRITCCVYSEFHVYSLTQSSVLIAIKDDLSVRLELCSFPCKIMLYIVCTESLQRIKKLGCRRKSLTC